MKLKVLSPADELGRSNSDASVEIQFAGGVAAAAVATGCLQEVVARKEDAAAGRAEVSGCTSTLKRERGKSGDEKGGKSCELHCVS